jgi:hypothetical protein
VAMLKIGEVWIDPGRVSSMEWDRRHYMNGPGESKLVVTMENGTRHIIHHQPHLLGGVDAYAIEKQIAEHQR